MPDSAVFVYGGRETGAGAAELRRGEAQAVRDEKCAVVCCVAIYLRTQNMRNRGSLVRYVVP